MQRMRMASMIITLAWATSVHAVETIVAFGDSTTAPRSVGTALNGRPPGMSTAGLNQDDPSNLPHNLVLQVDETSSQLYVYSDNLRDALFNVGFDLEAIDNEGIGGNRTDQALARLNPDVLGKSPNTVIIQFGINDSAHDGGPETPSRVALDFAEQTGGDGILGNGNDHPFASRGNYTDNLTQVVESLLNSNARVILMTPNQVVDYNVVTNARLNLYSQVVRDVADLEDAPLIDVWQMYEDYASIGNDIADLMLDGVHPNGFGHDLVANALFQLINDVGPPNGLVGDVNQNNFVFGDGTGPRESDDVTAFRDGWLTTGHVGAFDMYTHGDLNLDGITNLRDAFILHEALMAAGSDVPFGQLLEPAVPEPATWLLIIPCVAGILTVDGRKCTTMHIQGGLPGK